MPRVGLEIGRDTLRAVRVDRWRRRTDVLDLAWDPDAPAEAARVLRERLGTAARVALAFETSLLFVKRLRLPPVTAAEKERMLALEPERYFPIRGEEIVAAARDTDNLVFACPESLVVRCIEAFEHLGPVETVEPAPVAFARAIARGGAGRAVLLRVLAEGRGVEITAIDGALVMDARRLYGSVEVATRDLGRRNGQLPRIHLVPWTEEVARPLRERLANVAVEPVPAVHGIPATHLAAYGALLANPEEDVGTLAPRSQRRRNAARRRRRRLTAVAACAAALVFLVGSVDASRSRGLERLDAELAGLGARAGPLLALTREADALTHEARSLATIERERIDALQVLLALTARLPTDAYVRSLRGTGTDWQITGYARDAARLIPRFEADARFENVRFLAATTRVRRGDETYEDFSLALRVVPAP